MDESAANLPAAGTGDLLQLTVNGGLREVPVGSTIADLVALLGLPLAQVAVERNLLLVKRADYAATVLQAGDRLEVVTFFGGG